MADALVSAVLQQLAMIIDREVQQEAGLVIRLKKDIQKLSSSLKTIQIVLIDAEERQVKEGAVRTWLGKLRDISYDMDDVLDEWNTAILRSEIEGVTNFCNPQHKVCSFFPLFSCFCFKQVVLRRDIALKVKEINEELDALVREKDIHNFNMNRSIEKPKQLTSTSFIDMFEIYGRKEEKNTLISLLLSKISEKKDLDIISIVGMGGIGKTTLAKIAYNQDEVVSNFDKRMWISVSNHFDEIRIAKAIIEALTGTSSNLFELESLLQCIFESVVDKKFLLVLDDIWTDDCNKWEPFRHCLKNGLRGSKIIITTRKQTVARMMKSIDIINIAELPEEDCWLMFRQLAFFDRCYMECKELEEMGRKFVRKCKGLPLAVKTIGSLLHFKETEEEWLNILDSEMWKLEDFEKGLLPSLLMSYNDLPSAVKRCFSYCAIFPKGYVVNKHHLIRLWMAQGYLGLEPNKEMEIIGQEYFNSLVTRSFFQEFERDDDGNIIECKMHDIVHDFAQFLTQNECFIVGVNGLEKPVMNSTYQKAHHAMLKIGRGASFPISIYGVKKLHTILINYNTADYKSSNEVLLKLIDNLTRLRVLDLGGCLLDEIPKEVGKLIHLRNLNLSGLEIEKLPETLCELYNLQTLNLSWCIHLTKLPQEIGKLVNLRHLINNKTSLSYMPKGIERLTGLRTVNEFVASSDDPHRKACTVEGLKNLNLLRENLSIKGLGNVIDMNEARKAELQNKRSILNLCLNFVEDIEEDKRMNKNDEAVLEALHPPPNLKRLEIVCYRGNAVFPSWMLSLTNLRSLHLDYCIHCEHLPPLGKLSFLESLVIWGMRSVTRVGNEFLGIEGDGVSSSSSVIAFPKLKSLSFNGMVKWEEWDYVNTNSGEDLRIMPCLCSLRIRFCPRLKALPDHLLQMMTMEDTELDIYDCPMLEERLTGEDWPKIHSKDQCS